MQITYQLHSVVQIIYVQLLHTYRVHWQDAYGRPTAATAITLMDPYETSPGAREYPTR